MRMRLSGLLGIGLMPLLGVAASAQQSPASFQEVKAAPPSAPRLAVTPPSVRSIQPSNSYGAQKIFFSNGVNGSFDLIYQTLPGYRPLTLDLYTPAPGGLPKPVVVFVHGGGWNGGDARHAATFEDFPAQLAGLAAQGYVVASVTYRLSQEAQFPAQLQDVKAAIRWLRAGAANYNIDTTRVAVWGAAAGGQLATLAGVTCGVDRFEPLSDANARDLPSDCVQAVINWYGVSDLESLAEDGGKLPGSRQSFTAQSSSAEGNYLGCEPADCAPGLARLASPLSFISASSPPFLIQHGAADTTIPPKQSQKLQDALKAKHVPAELVLYPNAGHDFTRGGNPDPRLNAQAMEKLAAFLAALFPPSPLAGKAPPPMRRSALD